MQELSELETISVAGGDLWCSEEENDGNGSFGRYSVGSAGGGGAGLCSALGAGAGTSTGLITTGACTIGTIVLTKGTSAPGCSVIGSVTGSVVGAGVTAACKAAMP